MKKKNNWKTIVISILNLTHIFLSNEYNIRKKSVEIHSLLYSLALDN